MGKVDEAGEPEDLEIEAAVDSDRVSESMDHGKKARESLWEKTQKVDGGLM